MLLEKPPAAQHEGVSSSVMTAKDQTASRACRPLRAAPAACHTERRPAPQVKLRDAQKDWSLCIVALNTKLDLRRRSSLGMAGRRGGSQGTAGFARSLVLRCHHGG